MIYANFFNFGGTHTTGKTRGVGPVIGSITCPGRFAAVPPGICAYEVGRATRLKQLVG